jgi:peroxiredoxin family protein
MLLMFEVSEDFEASLDTLQELAKHKNVKILACGI